MFTKTILLLGLLALGGCKLAVIVVEGGEVQSGASETCAPALPPTNGNVCIHEITDTNFTDSFTAVPDPGWEFVKWNSVGDFFCADSTNPTCALSNAAGAGNPGIEAIVASDKTYYLMPVFQKIPPQEITDTVFADGREWAQVDLFTGLSWNEIDAICPSGACAGELNGYDMDGWTWASIEDLNGLFNFYAGSTIAGPGPGLITNATFVNAFFDAGWRATGQCGDDWRFVRALLSTSNDTLKGSIGLLGESDVVCSTNTPSANISDSWSTLDAGSDFDGAWFYRTP